MQSFNLSRKKKKKQKMCSETSRFKIQDSRDFISSTNTEPHKLMEEHANPHDLWEAVEAMSLSRVVQCISEGMPADYCDDDNHQTPLLVAAADGSVDIGKSLIGAGADVNHRDRRGNTALILAAARGSVEFIKLLLQYGALVDTYTNCPGSLSPESFTDQGQGVLQDDDDRSENLFGKTALLSAVDSGHFNVANLLLDNGAHPHRDCLNKDSIWIISNRRKCPLTFLNRLLQSGIDINEGDDLGITALMVAATYDRADVVESLINAGVTVDQRDNMGKTALMHAAWNMSLGALRSLVDHGHEFIDTVNSKGQTAFTITCHKLNSDTLDIFLTLNADIHHIDRDGSNAIHHCSAVNNSEMVSLLVKRDVRGDISNNINYTPLMIASQLGHLETVNVLLEHNVGINQVGKGGRTALMCAAYAGRPEIVKVLLDRGADIDATDEHCRTALILACLRHANTSLLLIEKGAQVRKTDVQGMTALHRAAQNYQNDVVCALLERGADPNLRYVNGDTPLWMAARGLSIESIPVIEALVHGGAHFHDEIHKIIILHHRSDDRIPSLIIQALVVHGADPSPRIGRNLGLKQFSEKFLTPFKLAILFGWTSIAKYFVINTFLHTSDIRLLTRDPELKQFMSCKGFSSSLQVLSTLYSQPWSLKTHSFIALSSALGSGSSRRDAVGQMVMPPSIARRLLFDTPHARLNENDLHALYQYSVADFV